MSGMRTILYRAGVVMVLAGILITLPGKSARAQEAQAMKPDKLLVVWTSADREVANNMVFMYSFNAMKQGWWKEVSLLIWGPSQKLLTQDADLQEYVKRMKDAGVKLLACKACADGYGVSADLQKLGVEVKYTGTTLTEMLKSGWTTITF